MKIPFTIISLLLCIGLIFSYFIFFLKEEPLKESISFFPIDPSVTFEQYDTRLTLLNERDENEYVIKWTTSSSLKNPVYLRQDISLLFEDGRLKEILSTWEEEIAELNQEKEVFGEDSSHYKAISFHHGEIHYMDDVIKSTQIMSKDHLYVIDSPMSPLESFKKAQTSEEKEWEKILNHATEQQLQYSWGNLLEYYNIPRDEYIPIPLTSLTEFNHKPLPGLTLVETHEKIGNLWEGLYKNYILGLEKEDGTSLSPKGSTIPLILLNRANHHLLILIEAKNGDYFQLLQY